VLPVNGVDKKPTLDEDMGEARSGRRYRRGDVCEGGCIAGPGTVVKPAVAMKLRGGEKAATPVKSMSK
jgi:hypothetical protein